MRFAALFILIFIGIAPLSWAQGVGSPSNQSSIDNERFNYFNTPRAYRADPEYKAMTRSLIRQGNIGFDFQRYRLRYVQSSWYDPIGEDILLELLSLAERTAQDEQAYDAFRDLVALHLAHIDVVMLARDKAREDKRFGNTKFYDRVVKGLLGSVLISGNGASVDLAYDVITFGEETMLLAQLGLRPLSTEYRQRGIREFHRHIVEEIDTGRKKEFFVNVRFPMSKLRHVRKNEAQKRNPLAR